MGVVETLCISPLAAVEEGSMGRTDVNMEWLGAYIKELLVVVGCKQMVLEFFSSVLW